MTTKYVTLLRCRCGTPRVFLRKRWHSKRERAQQLLKIYWHSFWTIPCKTIIQGEVLNPIFMQKSLYHNYLVIRVFLLNLWSQWKCIPLIFDLCQRNKRTYCSSYFNIKVLLFILSWAETAWCFRSRFIIEKLFDWHHL